MIDFHQAVLRAIIDRVGPRTDLQPQMPEQHLLWQLYEDLVWKSAMHSNARQLLFGVYKWRKEAKHAPASVVG